MNIPVPNDIVSTITGYVSGFMSDFSPYITLIIGIIAGFYILSYLIGILRGQDEQRRRMREYDEGSDEFYIDYEEDILRRGVDTNR